MLSSAEIVVMPKITVPLLPFMVQDPGIILWRKPEPLSLAFKAITALFLTFLSSIINPEHAPMLQLNQTAYTPTGSGFSLSLLKLFRLRFSF